MTNASTLVDRFAASLGWHGLERADITLTPDNCGEWPAGTVVTCWSTRDLRFFIQINQRTPGQFGVYNVSIVAERYNMAPLDFVASKFETVDEADCEAERLASLFARFNFRNARWRRRYLEQHPRKLLRRKKKWRGWKGRLRTKPLDERKSE